jgi:hypothetical protein
MKHNVKIIFPRINKGKCTLKIIKMMKALE